MAHDPDAMRQEYARQKQAHDRGDDLHKKGKPTSLTHIQIAQLYLNQHGIDTMYTRGLWYRYQRGVWAQMHDLLAEREVWRLLESHQFNGANRPTSYMHSSVSKCIKARLYIPESQVDADENLINLMNGVFSLSEQILYPHSPLFRMTNQLPFEYDRKAIAPKWQKYLESTFVKPRSNEFDQEIADFLAEAFGYSLTSSVSHHVTFWCYGQGANGKGVLFHILEKLAGNAAMPLNVGLLRREQYQLAMLAGKRIALCSEASATQNLVEDAIIKALISGDTISVRQIRREPFDLHPTCKLWWAMNELPAVADTSEGFWRRVRVIPFNRQFDVGERILDLKFKLEDELSGIFNWAMFGLLKLQARRRFQEPQQVIDSTEKYREESNPVNIFIKEGFDPDREGKVQASALYDAYKNWCYKNGYKALSSRRFKYEMERLKYFHKKETHSNVYTGLKQKPIPF